MQPSSLAFAVLTVVTLSTASNSEIVQSDTKLPNLSKLDSHSPSQDPDTCIITVAEKSIDFFRSQLESVRPNFIRFKIKYSTNITTYHTNLTFNPDRWVWTYKSPSGLYPYLFWNIDYNVLSFGLLDAKTLHRDIYVQLHIQRSCNITYGTNETTHAIANALKGMIAAITNGTDAYAEYDESYFCYLAQSNISNKSLSYLAAVYFMLPISYINYNCCRTIHSYTTKSFTVQCLDKHIDKWAQCNLWPYLLGIFIFLYFPIWMFKLASWISSDECVSPSDYEMLAPAYNARIEDEYQDGVDWIYLDGKTPYQFTDLLTNIWCGMNITWPTTVSRMRRFILLLLMPIGVYIQLIVYYREMQGDTKLLVEHGTPMGFLSLLGDQQYRQKTFATVFGGPEVMLVVYYLIGLFLLVVPRSLKQIVEDGMPTQSFRIESPLFMSATEVKRLSMVEYSLEPGYVKGVTMFKCGIYMLFCKRFWKSVFNTQFERMYDSTKPASSKLSFCLKLLVMPFYILFCMLEILLCLILYGIPFCMFTMIVLRGATRSLTGFRTYLMQYCHNHIIRKLILDNPVVTVLTYLTTLAIILMFSYAICLVFIETFDFMSEIIVFCFVAVIVYPSVSFGYLFFFVVLVYYIVRRISDFGDGYLELLSEAVDISRNLDGQPNYVTFFGDTMMIGNVKTPPGIRRIQINNTTIDVAQNILHSGLNDSRVRPKIKMVDNVYGIPRDLFTFLVKKHRPAHKQVLQVAFNIALIAVLIAVTIIISGKYVSGPSSEISEVMHVIFIVAVGALPRVLEVAMTSASESIKKEIELRRLEQLVVEFWEGKNENV